MFDRLNANAGHQNVDFAASAELGAREEDRGGARSNPQPKCLFHVPAFAKGENDAREEGVPGPYGADGAHAGGDAAQELAVGNGKRALSAARNNDLVHAGIVHLAGAVKRGFFIVEVATKKPLPAASAAPSASRTV